MNVNRFENPAQQSGSEHFRAVDYAAEPRSPSRVFGDPQPGLLATNQSKLKGA